MPRKPYRSDVTAAQWDRIKRWVPRPARTGRPRADEREGRKGVLYVLPTGCRWEDLPHDIRASPKPCTRRLLEYQRRRVWQRLVADLRREAERRGRLKLKNCSHAARVGKSKKGRPPRSGTRENPGLKGSNALWSLTPMGSPSTSPCVKRTAMTSASCGRRLRGFAAASASANPNAWGWTKATRANLSAVPYARGAWFRSPPIVSTRSPFLAAALLKMASTDAIAASGGRWNGRSVGSTPVGGWTAWWNLARKRIAPSCESFSSSIILLPYFPDLNEF